MIIAAEWIVSAFSGLLFFYMIRDSNVEFINWGCASRKLLWILIFRIRISELKCAGKARLIWNWLIKRICIWLSWDIGGFSCTWCICQIHEWICLTWGALKVVQQTLWLFLFIWFQVSDLEIEFIWLCFWLCFLSWIKGEYFRLRFIFIFIRLWRGIIWIRCLLECTFLLLWFVLGLNTGCKWICLLLSHILEDWLGWRVTALFLAL